VQVKYQTRKEII